MSDPSKPNECIQNLSLNYKNTIVDLMVAVQLGTCSCQRAATEIMKANERHLRHIGCFQCESCNRWSSEYFTDAIGDICLCQICFDELNNEDENKGNEDTPENL